MIDFVKDSAQHQKIMEAIDDKLCKTILTTLLNISCYSGISAREIAERTKIVPSVLSVHLKNLLEADMIMTGKKEPETLYYIDEEALIKNLINYVCYLSNP